MILRAHTEDEICAQNPSLSPPNVLIGGPVRNSPGFPLKACGNDGTETAKINVAFVFKGRHEVHEGRELNKGLKEFSIKNIGNLRILHDLRGWKVIRQSFGVTA